MLSASVRWLVLGAGLAVLFPAALFPAPALAAVTFTGTVTPGSQLEVDPSMIVTVGLSRIAEDFDPNADPRGAIRVDDGSLFQPGRLIVGDDDLAIARVEVSGPQSLIQVADSLVVGRAGSGYLRIDDGAWVNVGSQALGGGTMTIGVDRFHSGSVPPVASVEVLGESTLLTIGRQLNVGDGAVSRLSIRDGAVVRVGGFDGSVSIAGVIEVSGERAELQAPSMAIGSDFPRPNNQSSGELWIRDGAVVRSNGSGGRGLEIGFGSQVVLNGGVLAMPIESLRGVLRGSGTINNQFSGRGMNVDSLGRVLVEADESLRIDGDIGSNGDVAVSDGSFQVDGLFTNVDSGESAGRVIFSRSEVELRGGLNNQSHFHLTGSTLRLGAPFQSTPMVLASGRGVLKAEKSQVALSQPASLDGRLELIDSELIIDGSFGGPLRVESGQNTVGRIVLERSAIRVTGCCTGGISSQGVLEARGRDNVVETGVTGAGRLEIGPDAAIAMSLAEFGSGVSVAAGGTASFGSQLQLNDLSVALTEANLYRPSLVVESDFPLFLLEATIGGRLAIDADSLTNVEADQVYRLLEATTINGQFTEYDLPDLPGTLEFLPQLSMTELSLLVIDTTQTLPGDFTGDGVVDAADYTLMRDGLSSGGSWLDHMVWSQNYGRTLSPPGLAAVPEPTAGGLALLGLLAGSRFRRATSDGPHGGQNAPSPR